jgi:hypothetical protein
MTTAMTTREQAIRYVPGSTKFAPGMHVQYARGYRTWLSTDPSMAYGSECLLCGGWHPGLPSREDAVQWVTVTHLAWCHVVNGCHCPEPHLTAEMAARIGVKDNYPRKSAATLFRMAGGIRKYLPPSPDLNGIPFGGPEFGSGGYRWTR